MDELFYRSFEIDKKAINKDDRTVDLSFSSETPVKRWFENEYLLHGAKNVDLSRLKQLGAALFGHNSTFIVGALKNIRLEDQKGRATVVFDNDEDGEKVFKKVLSRSLKGVSVGYQVNQFREVQQDEIFEVDGKKFEGPAMVATRWTPYEISFTPIPADATVGVGRALTRDLSGIEIIKSKKTEEDQMEKKDVVLIIEEVLKGFETRLSAQVVDTVKAQLIEDAKPKMRIAPEQALDITGRAAAVSLECKSLVSDMILQGKNETECLRTIGDQAALKDAPDNKDKGGLPNGDGLVAKAATAGARIISFKQLEGDAGDDSFVRSLENPMQFSFGQ